MYLPIKPFIGIPIDKGLVLNKKNGVGGGAEEGGSKLEAQGDILSILTWTTMRPLCSTVYPGIYF